MSNVINRIDDSLSRLADRAELLRKVRALAEEDPGFVGELAAIFAEGMISQRRDKLSADPISIPDGTTQFDRVKLLFDRQNEWRSAADISKETGLRRGAVGFVLYKTGRDLFESKDAPGKKNRKLWRLSCFKSGNGRHE